LIFLNFYLTLWSIPKLFLKNIKTLKMKKLILSLLIPAFTFMIFLSSCQKDKSSSNDTQSEATTQSDDEFMLSNEVDAVSADANLVLNSQQAFAGRGEEVQTLICDATVVVDTLSDPRTITITYNGTNCLGNRTRTGVVVISMPQNTRWKNAGATVTIAYQNLKITRTSDNKSITINGSKTMTNESGGLLINLPNVNSITHLINSNGLSVTFDNNTQRNWKVARKYVFTYNNGVVLTISGTHTENGVNNIAEWGTNRFGGAFTTAISEPLVIRQDCNARITAGQVTHTTPNVTVNSTFGLDATGNPTSCPGSGSFYYKLTWTGPAGNTRTVILPY
jgi:hypothetical protein